MSKFNKGLYSSQRSGSDLGKSSPAKHRNSSFGEISQEDLAGWNNSPFSGFLRGSSADMPQFRAFRVVKHLMG